MSKQGRIHNFKERFGKPFRKRQKLGEDEDEWCDALNYLSLDSDDEYFDALEEQVPSQSLHTGTKRKKSGRKPSPKKESEMSRHSAQCSKPYTSGLGSKTTIYQPRQVSHVLYYFECHIVFWNIAFLLIIILIPLLLLLLIIVSICNNNKIIRSNCKAQILLYILYCAVLCHLSRIYISRRTRKVDKKEYLE